MTRETYQIELARNTCVIYAGKYSVQLGSTSADISMEVARQIMSLAGLEEPGEEE